MNENWNGCIVYTSDCTKYDMNDSFITSVSDHVKRTKQLGIQLGILPGNRREKTIN